MTLQHSHSKMEHKKMEHKKMEHKKMEHILVVPHSSYHTVCTRVS